MSLRFVVQGLRLESRVVFEERQRFRQWWVWGLLSGVFAFAVFDALVGSFTGGIWAVLLVSCVVALLFVMHLDTRVSSEGIFVKLFPIHFSFKHYPWEMISKVEVRKYNPIAEFGGWGYRWGFGGTAMNISGNMGLQLELTDGKKLLIGTQRPDDLRAVLNRLNKS